MYFSTIWNSGSLRCWFFVSFKREYLDVFTKRRWLKREGCDGLARSQPVLRRHPGEGESRDEGEGESRDEGEGESKDEGEGESEGESKDEGEGESAL